MNPTAPVTDDLEAGSKKKGFDDDDIETVGSADRSPKELGDIEIRSGEGGFEVPQTGNALAIDDNQVFRKDINGLRALSIVLIVLGSAGVPHLPSWFMGFDVGFTVAGYLSFLSLKEEASSITDLTTSTVGFVDYYGRRLKRIFPSTMCWLVIMLALSLIIDTETLLSNSLRHLAFSAGFVENVALIADGVDPVSTTNPPYVLLSQHLWALSLHIQWGLLAPVLFSSVTFVSGHRESWTQLIMWILAIASLSVQLALAQEHTGHAFYGFPARLWEFCVGAAVALLSSEQAGSMKYNVRYGLSWCAHIGIVLCAIFFSKEALPYPGPSVLVPVLLAALIIHVRCVSGSKFSPGIVLHSKPVQILGNISFPLYLASWPLIAAPVIVRSGENVSTLEKLGLAACSVPLAWCTHKLVEKKLPRKKWLKDFEPKIVVSFSVITAALFAEARCARLSKNEEPHGFRNIRAMQPPFRIAFLFSSATQFDLVHVWNDYFEEAKLYRPPNELIEFINSRPLFRKLSSDIPEDELSYLLSNLDKKSDIPDFTESADGSECRSFSFRPENFKGHFPLWKGHQDDEYWTDGIKSETISVFSSLLNVDHHEAAIRETENLPGILKNTLVITPAYSKRHFELGAYGRLYQAARDLDPKASFFINLSAACVPIKPFRELYETIAKNPRTRVQMAPVQLFKQPLKAESWRIVGRRHVHLMLSVPEVMALPPVMCGRIRMASQGEIRFLDILARSDPITWQEEINDGIIRLHTDLFDGTEGKLCDRKWATYAAWPECMAKLGKGERHDGGHPYTLKVLYEQAMIDLIYDDYSGFFLRKMATDCLVENSDPPVLCTSRLQSLLHQKRLELDRAS